MSHTIKLSLGSDLAEAGISVLFVLAAGELNSGAAESAAKLWRDAQASIMQHHTSEELLAHSHLAGYRALHDRFRITEPQLIPSPESLLRILFEEKALRSLGTIVDIYNSISVQHLLSVGGHNARKLGAELKLAINQDGVRFRPLGQKKKITLPPHEYSYRTDAERVICRLECRQANDTKIKEDTTMWLFILQGNAQIEREKLLAGGAALTAALAPRISNFRCHQCLLGTGSLQGNLSIPNPSKNAVN